MTSSMFFYDFIIPKTKNNSIFALHNRGDTQAANEGRL